MAIDTRAEKATNKVIYELNMIRMTGKELLNENYSDVVKTALLESFLLHVRTLYNFLTLKKDNKKFKTNTGKTKDMLAIHYFIEPKKWNNISGRLFKYCRDNLASKKEELTKINEHLTHLTYSRNSVKISWDIAAILKDVEESWKVFIDKLEKEQLTWFNRHTKKQSIITFLTVGKFTSTVRTSQGFSQTLNGEDC